MKNGNLTREQAIALVGEELVKKVEAKNCDLRDCVELDSLDWEIEGYEVD